ncbi:MAG: hypothetical protein QM684_10655, partial [Rhizobium sp.]
AGSNASDSESSGNAALANSLDRFPIWVSSFDLCPPNCESQRARRLPQDTGRFSVLMRLNRGKPLYVPELLGRRN